MTTELILISLCLFFSVLNLTFTVFLSNSIFRFLTGLSSGIREGARIEDSPSDSGLVDPKNSVTYDRRFVG